MNGGDDTDIPEPSSEERALQRSQADLLATQRQILEDQRRQQQVLLPFLAEQEGFDVDTDDRGNITGIRKIDDPLDAGRKEIERLLQDRSLAALRGELPVDPALERALGEQEATLREQLSGQLGPGYETSSPGIEALDKFRQTAETLRSNARTGQLTLAEQLGLVREQEGIFRKQSSQDTLRQVGIGDPMAFAGAFGQVAGGYGAAQAPFMQQRQMQYGANMGRLQSRTQLLGAGIGAAGDIASSFIFSDERAKADLVQIGETLRYGIPIYEYTDLGTGDRKIGVLAQDVADVVPTSVRVDPGTGLAQVRYEDLKGL